MAKANDLITFCSDNEDKSQQPRLLESKATPVKRKNQDLERNELVVKDKVASPLASMSNPTKRRHDEKNSRFKISLSTLNQISAANKLRSAKTPIRPVDREILTSEVLHRIVNWQHDWVLVTFFLF